MQIPVNSANIIDFGFSVVFDIYNRTVTFDTANLTTYTTGGINNVQGIAFSLNSQGVELANGGIDWDSPQLPSPATNKVYVLDLISLGLPFWFTNFQITGAIKDQNGTIYTTIPVIKTICQPVGINEDGYVDGIFKITSDCVNNLLSVSEGTLLTYNGLFPNTVTKNGTLYYPTGTISPVSFTGTPFNNNQIFTGSYRISCTTVGQYNLQDDVYVNVTYITNNSFDVTCQSTMNDLFCCFQKIQKTAIEHCNDAIGLNARNQLNEISTYFLSGLLGEISGEDVSFQYNYIKKKLSCDCGKNKIRQNEVNPINPTVYDIIVVGVNGNPTTVTSSQNGTTKTFTVSSKAYQVVKGDTGDLAFTITTDTSVNNVVKYKISFNYSVMAGYILTAIGGSPSLIAQLNSLVSFITDIDLSNLDGKCIIDLSSINYFLSQLIPNSAVIFKSILIGSTTHVAPAGLLVTNEAGIESYVNGLGFGVFRSSFSQGTSGAYFNMLTNSNANSPVSIVLTINGVDQIVLFQKTNHSLIAFLQAVVDFMCNYTANQMALGNAISLCQFDYSGNVVVVDFTDSQTQSQYNAGISASICNIVNRINSLTSITCNTIKSLFSDNINIIFGNADRFLSIMGGNCISATNRQAALAIIAAINSYTDVKAAFCAIDCNAPSSCPDVVAINLGLSGSDIGFYGLSWSSAPSGIQTVTVQYRETTSGTYITATNALQIFPNGNLVGTTPYIIPSPTPGATYNVKITNNCGGLGFVGNISIPSGSIYSGSYLVNSVLYNICASSPMILYSNSPFAIGITLYLDSGLTTPITGYTLVAPVSTQQVYGLNTSTGVVGSSTGITCGSGTGGSYQLGNTLGSICSQMSQVLYTSGGFVIGGTLYVDSALTTPVTGYSYVVNGADNHVYYLNFATGVIGSDTGIICGFSNVLAIGESTYGGTVTSISGLSPFALSGSLSANQNQSGVHGTVNNVVTIVTTSGGSGDGCDIYINATFFARVNTNSGAGTYVSPSITASSSDPIELDFNNNL